MSACIRIKILGGTDIDTAYEDCGAISERLGGIAVETSFNGVEMFYHGQTLSEWEDEFCKRIYGASKKGGAK